MTGSCVSSPRLSDLSSEIKGKSPLDELNQIFTLHWRRTSGRGVKIEGSLGGLGDDVATFVEFYKIVVNKKAFGFRGDDACIDSERRNCCFRLLTSESV
jgi:hypothetical protein